MAIDMWRLVVCWNHIDGVVVWWVSPYMSLHSSPHMVLTPSRRWCSEFVANVHALKRRTHLSWIEQLVCSPPWWLGWWELRGWHSKEYVGGVPESS